MLGVVVMDNRQWDNHQLSSGAQRVRSQHAMNMSTEAIPAMNGYSHAHEREPVVAPEWRRRQYPSQPGANQWELQTDWWLAQQNNVTPVAPMNREDRSQSSQASESEPVFLRDGSINQTHHWPWRPEDGDIVYGPEGRLLGAREAVVTVAAPGGFNGALHNNSNGSLMVDPTVKISPLGVQAMEAPPLRREMHEAAAPQARKGVTSLVEMEKRCEKCSHSEGLLRECSVSFSKLADSVCSGALSEPMGQTRKEVAPHDKLPHISEMHRIVDLLKEANSLAKRIVKISPSQMQTTKMNSPLDANDPQQASLETMKRRFLAESQDTSKRQRRQSADANSSFEVHDYNVSAGKSESNALGGPLSLLSATAAIHDVLPPIRSQSPSHMVSDGYGTRLPSMKPPPTPGRQLPSPPGRSQPSPPSYSAPSPSPMSSQYAVTTNAASLVKPSAHTVLQPLSPTPSSTLGHATAVQVHTAALQHEVSVNKCALQSLQGEHDKLLAAFRRSQTRARALEDKQVASDLEINNLAEERVRLLTQAQELEQSIADISKSRDEFRQAAVKGGAQYVEMVRKASQLEMMAGDERRELKRKLDEQRATIETLKSRPQSSVGDFQGRTAGSAGQAVGNVEDLRREIHHLKIRCAEMEMTLSNIRSESNRFGETVAGLSDFGDKIFQFADTALSASLETQKNRELPSSRLERSVALITSPH